MASTFHVGGALPVGMVISQPDVQIEMASMTCPDVTTNLFMGVYRGSPARFVEKRQLRSLTQAGLDVRSVQANEAVFRRIHENPRHVPVAGVYQTNPTLGGRVFLVEAPYHYTHLEGYLSANPGANRTLLWKQAVEILVHLHTRGVVHGSIMIDSFAIDRCGNLCLSRFDNMRGEDPDTPFYAICNPSVGAMAFMAPELLQSLRAGDEAAGLTSATDVYALGCFGYQLFTRTDPFVKYTRSRNPAIAQVELAAAVVDLQERPTGPMEGNEGVWNAVEACWASNPANRITAPALLQHLEGVLGVSGLAVE